MRRNVSFVSAITLALAAVLSMACASRPSLPPELVPPRLDLARYRTLGLLEFTSSGSKQKLGPAATREFLAALHDAQPGTPVLELGSLKQALGSKSGATDPAALRALAERSHVDVIVVGELTEHKASPRVSLEPAYGVASASAKLSVSLDVRILDGASGATVWSSSSRREIDIAGIDLTTAGISRIDANPAEEARRILVRDLIEDVTFDLRPRWVQR